MRTQRFAHRFISSACIALLALLLIATPVLAAFIPSNGQAATLVLGQPNFTSQVYRTTRNGMFYPSSVAVDPTTHKVFVADSSNNRVLRFASANALANGAAAEVVLGQLGFTWRNWNTDPYGMYSPGGIFVDAGGRLWVADSRNNRILRFDNASGLANDPGASGVLGQPDFYSSNYATTQNGVNSPSGVFMDASGRLWVADSGNHRILRFDSAALKANGANADGVLGQPDFTTSDYATTQNSMYYPLGVAVDAGGRLWVADASNNRILRFDNAALKANGANADGVLGQPNFTSSTFKTTRIGMYSPGSVAIYNVGGQLYVSDYGNNRILVFNAAAGLANGANASYVLGQTNFTDNTEGVSATTLWSPKGLFFDLVAKVLLVADGDNNRVLMYGRPSLYTTANSTAAYDGWVLASTAANTAGGSKSATGTLRVGDDASNRQYRSILSFNTSALPDNAVIRSATLAIVKAGGVGTDPLESHALGLLLADMKKGSFGATALELSDFQAIPSASAVGHFTVLGKGWCQFVLPASDYPYINLTGTTQFRLRFSIASNNNHVAEIDSFYAGDATTAADRPVLTVQYSLP